MGCSLVDIVASFSPFTMPLTGQHLIEASAGTGKTWTLAVLYCRFLLEQQRDLKQVVVVTFTVPATEELKIRLRVRLQSLAQALLGCADQHGEVIDEIDPLLQHLLAQQSAAYWLPRVQQVLAAFDEAQIYTIHGFCQRILKDQALENAVPFEFELQENQVLYEQCTADFWRMQLATATSLQAQAWFRKDLNPTQLLQSLRLALMQPDAILDQPHVDISLQTLQKPWQEVLDEAQAVWDAQQIESLLTQAVEQKKINGKRYKLPLTKLMHAVRCMFKGEWPEISHLEKLSAAYLSQHTNKDKTTPQHEFFTVMDGVIGLAQRLQQAQHDNQHGLLYQLWVYLQTAVPARQAQLQCLSFNDLLIRLHQALHSQHGAALAQSLRQRYPVALIDEFQDTDPIQCAIFSKIYRQVDGVTAMDHTALVLVGDPKQAIYRFRGADIDTYLQMRINMVQHTLATNYRASSELIAALNAIYQPLPLPFAIPDMHYQPVVAGRSNTISGITERGLRLAPITLLPLQSVAQVPLNKGEAESLAVAQTAQRIATLLQDKAHFSDGSIIQPSDIAVLVRTNKQATVMMAALAQKKVAAIAVQKDSVFQSMEANYCHDWLMLLQEPYDLLRLKRILCWPVLQHTVADLTHLEQDSAAQMLQMARCQRYRDILVQHGVMAAFTRWWQDSQLTSQYLMQNNERAITNWQHIIQLLHAFSYQSNRDITQLLVWLNQQINQQQAPLESHLLRLETDAQRVQILTMHRAKGLEFAVVFCPYLWEEISPPKPEELISYRAQTGERRLTWDDQGQYHAYGWQQNIAESLRLQYVALTRAREALFLCWGLVAKGSSKAGKELPLYPLGYLLHPQRVTPTQGLALASWEALTDDLVPLQQWGVIMQAAQATPLDSCSESHVSPIVPNKLLIERKIMRSLYFAWQLTSFSKMAAHSHKIREEQPDYEWSHPREQTEQHTAFGLPKGAQIGTLLHHCLETQTLAWWREAAIAQQLVFCQQQLQDFDQDQQWADVLVDILRTTVTTPLHNEFVLADLLPKACLVELPFWLSFSAKTDKQWQQGFKAIMPHIYHAAIDHIAIDAIEGYLTGFIDLVFVDQDKYYIVDYKSNYLGDHQDDYALDSLSLAMCHSHYMLQYHIYALALHRHLKLTLSDAYQPERHFGGVYYLFLRGMQTSARSGIYYDPLSAERLDQLDVLFG